MVGDLKGGHLFFLQPLAHGPQRVLRLREIDRLGAATGGGGQVQRRRIRRQMALEHVVQAREAEEDLVRQAVIGELRLVEGLDEVDVEIAFRLRRGAIIGRSKEQVAQAFNPPLLPFELVLPDLETGVAEFVAALHERPHGAVVGAVEGVVGQGLGPLLDLGVVVDVFLEVEVILLGVRRFGDELTVDGLQHLPQYGLHHRQEVLGRLARHVLDTRLEQAQGVAEFGGGGANGYVNVAARGQTVHGQRVDDA